MKDININIFDDCNKLLFHQSNSNGRHVSSTLLNPLETVRTLFKQHGMRLDSTEGSFDTGKKTVFRHYPYNKVSIVFVILDWEKGRAPADEKACKGLIEVVYYLLIMFGGQDTDFCTSDQVKSLKIGEVFREVRGIVGHLLDSFPDLDGAPLSLVTQAPRVARLSRPVGSKFKSFFQSCEGQDDIVAAAVFNGSTTLAMSHSYRAQSGMSGVLLRFALPLALSQQPLATMRDMPFFGLPEGQLRASTLLLKDDVRLVLITQVDGPSMLLCLTKISSKYPSGGCAIIPLCNYAQLNADGGCGGGFARLRNIVLTFFSIASTNCRHPLLTHPIWGPYSARITAIMVWWKGGAIFVLFLCYFCAIFVLFLCYFLLFWVVSHTILVIKHTLNHHLTPSQASKS